VAKKEIQKTIKEPFDDSQQYKHLPLSLKRHHKIIIPQRIIKERKHKEIIDAFIDETIKKNPDATNFKLSIFKATEFVPFHKTPMNQK